MRSWRRRKAVWLGVMVWGAAAVYVAVTPPRIAFESWRFSAEWADHLFRVWTWLGHGLVLAVAAAAVIIRQRRAWRWVVCAVAAFAITNAFLKRVVFKNAMRPAAYAEVWNTPIRSPVKLHYRHAMPSGHTGTAFAAATILALGVRRRSVALAAYGLAAGVAYSRVYLGQHFPADVVVGAAVGTLIPLICFQWLGKTR